MTNEENIIEYVNEIEKTDVSYVRVGHGESPNLIISYSSNIHTGFERKKSLVKLKCELNTFDIIYIRNPNGWYIGNLFNIGKDVSDTIKFLENVAKPYKNVVFTGFSMGGYASILFGSLLNIKRVVAVNPQIDLLGMCNQLQIRKKPRFFNPFKKIYNLITTNELAKKYADISRYINKNTEYIIYSDGDNQFHKWAKKLRAMEIALHGDYQVEKITQYDNVKWIKGSVSEARKQILKNIIECVADA